MCPTCQTSPLTSMTCCAAASTSPHRVVLCRWTRLDGRAGQPGAGQACRAGLDRPRRPARRPGRIYLGRAARLASGDPAPHAIYFQAPGRPFAMSPAMRASCPSSGCHRGGECRYLDCLAGIAQGAVRAPVVMRSLASRSATQRTRSSVVMPGGMSMTFWPTLAQVERTTRLAADCRSSTLVR